MLPARLAESTRGSIITDFNPVQKSGWYFADTGATNAPAAGAWHLQVIALDADANGAVEQIAFSATDYRIYVRNIWYAAWMPWVKIYPVPVDDASLPERLQSNAKPPPGNDLNNAEAGWHYANDSVANGPAPGSGQWYHVQTLFFGGPQKTQIAYQAFVNRILVRRCDSGTWSSWYQIYPIDDTTLPPRLKTAGPSLTDLNLGNESGWYHIEGTPANCPPGYGWGHLQTYAWQQGGDVNYCNQVFYALGGNVIFTRWCYGTWSSWVKVFPVDDTNLPPRLASVSTYTGDWNDAKTNGWYHSGTVPNSPAPGYWVIGHVSTGNGGVSQTVWMRDAMAEWRRFSMDGITWQPWVQTWPPNEAFLPLRLRAISYEPADLNSVVENGWCFANSCLNRPPSSVTQWFVQTIMWGSTDYGVQVAYSLGGPQVWTRNRYAASWGAWVQTFPSVSDASLPPRLQTYGDISITDLNAATQSGWYRGNNAANAPNGWGYGLLFTQSWAGDAGHIGQLWWPMNNATELWHRASNNYTWQAWHRVYPIDDGGLPNRIKTNSTYIADCNDPALGNGWYGTSPSTTNTAMGGVYGYLRVQQLDGQMIQTAWPSYTGDDQYERRRNDGGWSPWQKTMRPTLWGTSTYATSNDANLAIDNGWSYIDPGGANGPVAGVWWKLQTINMNTTGNVTQFATAYNTDEMWFRRRVDGTTWTAWKKIYPAASRYGLEPVGPQVSDLNTVTDNGWYCTVPGVVNAPVSDYGSVMYSNITYGAAGRMIFYQHASYNTWQRFNNGGTWSAWVQTWPVAAGAGAVQAGYVDAPYNTGSPWTLHITFPVAFSTIPSIAIELDGTNLGWANPGDAGWTYDQDKAMGPFRVLSIQTDGAWIRVHSNDLTLVYTGVRMRWIAAA